MCTYDPENIPSLDSASLITYQGKWTCGWSTAMTDNISTTSYGSIGKIN